MTPTARAAAAQRRRRQIINQTVRDRAMHDPRRRPVEAVPASK
ncbi:hypothetical protein [Actinomadura barringtoniae]|nr:hypothetical protein [Actinomadura barringtoniae]